MPWNQTTSRITGFTVTAAVWNDEIVENFEYLEEINYTEFTSDVSVTGTANVDIVSSGAITYEAVPTLIEFFAVRINVGASGLIKIKVMDGATEIGIVASHLASSGTACYAAHRLTPSAGSHTYKIAGDNAASQTSTVLAGAGGTDVNLPGFIRITRVPT